MKDLLNIDSGAKTKALDKAKKPKGPIPKDDWRKGKTRAQLDSDYPDAKAGSDYMGSR